MIRRIITCTCILAILLFITVLNAQGLSIRSPAKRVTLACGQRPLAKVGTYVPTSLRSKTTSQISGLKINQKIDEVVDAFVELEQFSGTILVAKDGEPLYTRAVGLADRDHGVKNTLNTKFNIGSIGKTITGTAIMQLVEKGIINVTDPASKYLKGFPHGD